MKTVAWPLQVSNTHPEIPPGMVAFSVLIVLKDHLMLFTEATGIIHCDATGEAVGDLFVKTDWSFKSSIKY